MKNVKKIVAGAAALGVGALMITGAMAANVTPDEWNTNLVKGDLFTNGVPGVSIVVGSAALASDFVWAGNIAAAIGAKAYTTADTAGGYTFNNVVVEVGSEGSSTVTGDGKLYDNVSLNFATGSDITLRYSDAGFLHNETVDVDGSTAFSGNSFSSNKMTVKDEITVDGANFGFNSDKDVADVVASFPDQSLIYTMTFSGNGIPVGYKDADSDERLTIKFFNKDYIVDEATATSLKLILDKEDLSLSAGDTFVPEDGFVIEVMALLEASSSTFAAELELRDSDGTVIKTAVFEDGDSVFKNELDAIVSINTVYNSRVTLTTGAASSITLTDGADIEDFPNTGDELWEVELTESGGAPATHIDKIVINNNYEYEFIDEDALTEGESIDIFGGLAEINFLGTTDETTFDFEIADNKISYVDDLGNELDLFMYENKTSTDLTRYTTRGEVDGQKLYFEFTPAADTFTVQLNDSDGDYLSAVTGGSWQSGSAALAYDDGYWTDFDIPSYDNSSITYNYGILVEEAASKVTNFALGLKEGQINNAFEGIATILRFNGYDITPISGVYAGIANTPYFGATAYNTGGSTKWDGSVSAEYEAYGEFTLTDGTDTLKAYVDVWTGKLVDTESSNFDDLSFMVNQGTYTLGIRNSDDLDWGLTQNGIKFGIDNKDFYAEIPDNALKAKAFIGGGASTTTELVGATLTLTEEGVIVSNDDETISAKLVSKDIDGGVAGTAITPANWTPSNFVVLDTQSPAGTKIIVGGYAVNSLAQGMGLEEIITSTGDYVFGKTEAGNIVVAGMTKEDTATAAQALLTAIESM